MEVSNIEWEGDVNVNVVCCVQSSLPREDLDVLLGKKKSLRMKLLGADHHRAFPCKCLKAKVTPKGIKIVRWGNPIQGVGSKVTAARIVQIHKTTEEGIVKTLVDHYDNYIEVSKRELQDIEKDIQSRPSRDR